MPPIKLNIFQRGAFQKATTYFLYFFSIALGAFILDWADKRLFTTTIKEAEQRGIIPPDAASGLQRFIEGRDGTVIFAIILIGLFCVALGWLFMRWASKRNWSWPVVLPKALEFRSAMRRLGITEPEEEIAFVKKHKIHVFIAIKPLAGDEQEKVKAQLYAFAHHSSFSEAEIFERHIGKKTLCFDADDYERLVLTGKKRSTLEESAAIAEKDEEIKRLRANLAYAVQDNETLSKERDELRGKVQMQPAHEDSRVDRLRVEHLLWSAYIPAMERLLREAPEGKQYTTPEIKNIFAAEWERRDDLRERMKQLTGSETASPSESFMKAVKAEFKAQGKLSTGGRPTKNP